MDLEILGVTKVKELIAKSDYLVPSINEGDKKPSFDGEIEVYNKSGNTHKKSDMIIRVPVQVKCSCQDRHPKTTSFSIDVPDLKNYLNAGGTIFFVVYVSEDGERKSVYYKELLPFELKKICEKANGQGTKTIHLRKFPTHKKDISNVVLNFANDMKKQYASITAESVSFDDLLKDGKPKEISFSYTDIDPDKSKPFDYIFNNRVYLYATFEHGVKLPVEQIEQITMASTEVNAPIKIAEKVYYDKYAVVFNKEGIGFNFGAGISVKANKEKQTTNISLLFKGNLSQRIKDHQFMLDALANNGFSINGVFVDLSSVSSAEREAFNSEEKITQLEFMKKSQSLFSKLYVQNDLEIEKVDDKSNRNLIMLLDSLIDNKEVSLKSEESTAGIITVGNLKLLMCAIKQESGLFSICDIYNRTMIAKVVLTDGTEISAPMGITLKRDVLQQIDNLNFEIIIDELNCFDKTSDLMGITIEFLLETIHAYDLSSSKRKKELLRDGAIKIIEWIKNNDESTPVAVHVLNELQIIKRERSLTEIETNSLNEIIEDAEREDIKTGAYLLLGNQPSAERHFEKMEPDLQKNFKNYPIYHFWNNKEVTTNG